MDGGIHLRKQNAACWPRQGAMSRWLGNRYSMSAEAPFPLCPGSPPSPSLETTSSLLQDLSPGSPLLFYSGLFFLTRPFVFRLNHHYDNFKNVKQKGRVNLKTLELLRFVIKSFKEREIGYYNFYFDCRIFKHSRHAEYLQSQDWKEARQERNCSTTLRGEKKFSNQDKYKRTDTDNGVVIAEWRGVKRVEGGGRG